MFFFNEIAFVLGCKDALVYTFLLGAQEYVYGKITTNNRNHTIQQDNNIISLRFLFKWLFVGK